jgi:hypothetical protein
MELSALRTRITASGLFPAPAWGQAVRMANNQHEPDVTDDSSAPQTEESRSPEATTAVVARMLANPRRIRRN